MSSSDQQDNLENKIKESSSLVSSETMELNKKWVIINTFFYLVLSFVAYYFFRVIAFGISSGIMESKLPQSYVSSEMAIDGIMNMIKIYAGVLQFFIPAICIYYFFRVSQDAKKLAQKILFRPYIILSLITVLLSISGLVNSDFSYLISIAVIPVLFWNIDKAQILKRALIATGILYVFNLFSLSVSIGLPAMLQIEYAMWLYMKTPTLLLFILVYHLLIGFLFFKIISPNFKTKLKYDGLSLIRKTYNNSLKSYVDTIIPYLIFKESGYNKKVFLGIWLLIGFIFVFSYSPAVSTIGYDQYGANFSERYREWHENIPAFVIFFLAPVVGIYWFNNRLGDKTFKQ